MKVTSFTFNGAKAVTPAQLKSVLATSASSRIPWGTKHYFSRDQFDADLKRIVAFYKDRGYPDARITSTDVKLNEDQTSVKLAINIDEGEPMRVERVVFTGFDALPAQHRTVLEIEAAAAGRSAARPRADAGEPRIGARRAQGPRLSLRVRQDVRGRRRVAEKSSRVARRRSGPAVDVRSHRSRRQHERGRRSHTPTARVSFGASVPAERAPGESAPALLTAELFEFANVEPVRSDEKPPEIPTRVTVTEGKHQQVNFGVGYGSEERARVQVDWRK